MEHILLFSFIVSRRILKFVQLLFFLLHRIFSLTRMGTKNPVSLCLEEHETCFSEHLSENYVFQKVKEETNNNYIRGEIEFMCIS